jgi:phage host-nuclease inhibitor protein Gam
MSTRNDSAAIRTATAALRREVERLDVKMKENIGTLKNEYALAFRFPSHDCFHLVAEENTDGTGYSEE